MQSTGVCAEVGRAGDAQDRGGEGEGSESSTTARESGRRRGGWKTIYLVYSRSGCVEDSPISQLSPRAHARLERSPNAGQAPSPIGHPVAWRVGCSQPTEITCPIRLGPRTSPPLSRAASPSLSPAGRSHPPTPGLTWSPPIIRFCDSAVQDALATATRVHITTVAHGGQGEVWLKYCIRDVQGSGGACPSQGKPLQNKACNVPAPLGGRTAFARAVRRLGQSAAARHTWAFCPPAAPSGSQLPISAAVRSQ